jgi:hypothetical protein
LIAGGYKGIKVYIRPPQVLTKGDETKQSTNRRKKEETFTEFVRE